MCNYVLSVDTKFAVCHRVEHSHEAMLCQTPADSNHPKLGASADGS